VNAGEGSSSPAQWDGWGVKMRTGHPADAEKQDFGVVKWLSRPMTGVESQK
jgi:hypothetical protein